MLARMLTVPMTMLALVAGVSYASAASLSNVHGNVSVVQGGAASTGFSGETLAPGDVVLAGNGGATVIYSASCAIHIAPGGSVTITADAPCPAVASGDRSVMFAVAGGLVLTGLIVGLSQHQSQPASH